MYTIFLTFTNIVLCNYVLNLSNSCNIIVQESEHWRQSNIDIFIQKICAELLTMNTAATSIEIILSCPEYQLSTEIITTETALM